MMKYAKYFYSLYASMKNPMTSMELFKSTKCYLYWKKVL